MTSLPEQIGPYRVLAKLGEGGMGLVYDAIDPRLGRKVALKTIRQDAVGNAITRDRFWREARLAASVNHPHVCQIYEIGEAGPELFIAMERLEGESLSVRLERGALPLTDTVKVGLQVLSALGALHDRRIVHRDLKPSNVFLTNHGVKPLDFGLARPFVDEDAETQLSLTETGIIVGTPQYMAPEQLQSRSVDARTDLFVLGAILYEMLSGHSPFAAASLPAAIAMILHTDPPMLGGSPGIGAADRVIHRALAKTPECRYASAAAMADDLRTVLLSSDGEPRQARPVTRLIVLPFRLLRPDADTDFLTFSLADAITDTLSSLESLVVRSPLAVAHLAAAVPDLKAIAEDADVDVALSGTVLRAADQLRVSTQLIAVPSGTLMWSYSSQVPVGNIFRLQDDLVRGIVESLALALSRNEQLALGRDVPRSAKAYEFYLRANQLSRDPESLDVARGLYLECLQTDPDYAPAWAQIGRVHRVIAKLRGDADSMTSAQSALDRALQLNPLLSIADRFYAEAEIDAGRALDAMVRLVRRASSPSNDSQLYAALVSACRYCGLMQASVAAHERAKRLDPHVTTSLMHTLIMMGDYQRAAAEVDPHYPGAWIPASMGALSGASQQCRADAERARALKMTWLANLISAWADMLEGAGSHDAVYSATEVAFNFPPDLDGWFYGALGLSQFGGERGADRAVAVLGELLGRGFVPYDTLMQHSWLDSLRHRPDFIRILQDVKHRHQQAQTAFTHAGGEALLGAGTTGSFFSW